MQTPQGFTLVETLVVIALMALLLTLSIPNLMEMARNYHIKTSASQMMAHIRTARYMALQQKTSYRILIFSGVSPELKNTYILQKDSDADGIYENIRNAVFPFPSGVSIDEEGITEIRFDPRGSCSRVPSEKNSVVLKRPDGKRYIITLTPGCLVTAGTL